MAGVEEMPATVCGSGWEPRGPETRRVQIHRRGSEAPEQEERVGPGVWGLGAAGAHGLCSLLSMARRS